MKTLYVYNGGKRKIEMNSKHNKKCHHHQVVVIAQSALSPCISLTYSLSPPLSLSPSYRLLLLVNPQNW